MKKKLSTSEILAKARTAVNPAIVTPATRGSGCTEYGWSVRTADSETYYEKTISTKDERQQLNELTEFWRKLAHEIQIAGHDKSWNVLFVEATIDYGSIIGTAEFVNSTTKQIDITKPSCRLRIYLSIPHWEELWMAIPEDDEAAWETAAQALETSKYDLIELAALQEPARSALVQLKKDRDFDIWIQAHDAPESGRFISVSTTMG